MTASKSILFVCTGNIFRSLSAERSFKKYLADNDIPDWAVGSAGIMADPQPIDPKTAETLRELGMDVSDHEQRRLTREILDEYDIIVGMAQDHIDFIKSEFGYKYAILFDELALQEDASVTDIDSVPNYLTDRKAVEEKIERTVKDICAETPQVFKNASERFYLFSDFVAGKTTHRNGYPFITLYETPSSIAFMSVDIPRKEDGHVLVIPKKRYRNLGEIPDETLEDIMVAVKKIGAAIDLEHGGYNVIVNNGLEAGQYIIHTHFHVIPRRGGDDITVEGWDRPGISKERFMEINEKLKRQIAG